MHCYSQSVWYGGVKFRDMDVLSPVWDFFNLTPDGLGERMPRRAYD